MIYGSKSTNVKDSVMDQIKVLIVDDNEVVREGIDALLSPHDDKQPDIKILFLTVYGEYAGDALEAGASWYLTKDCRRQDLLEAIRTLAQSKRAKEKRHAS
jgi:DNA-binding NarL/FixJ family response regulator